MRSFSVFALILALAAGTASASGNSNNSTTATSGDTSATATATNTNSNTNSNSATGGAANSGSTAIAGGGAGGRADAELNAIVQQYGGSLKSSVDVDTSNKNIVGQGQGQDQDQLQKQKQNSTLVNAPVTLFEGNDVRGAAEEARKALERHAETAPNAAGFTVGGDTPCGDITGLSGQVSQGGAGFSTTSETCKAYRLMILDYQANSFANLTGGKVPFSVKLAKFEHYAVFPFRFALNLATFGVLN